MSQTEVQLIKSSSVVDGDIVGMSSSKLSGTLPAVSGANLTNLPAANLTGALPAISGANLTGISAGITMADKWAMTNDYSLSNASTYYTITGTWARSTSAGYSGSGSAIGSAMTESSGVFTFPSTGIYYIVYDCLTGTTQDQTNMWSYITVGADNTSTNYLSVMASSGDSGTMNTVTHSAMLDVTNTSNQKVFLRGYAGNTGSYVSGNANLQRSAVTFIRLGDT